MAFGFCARHHFFWGEIAEVFKFQVCFGRIVEDGLGCDPVRNGIFIIRVIELVLVNRINENFTQDDFIKTVIEWNQNSPHPENVISGIV